MGSTVQVIGPFRSHPPACIVLDRASNRASP